MSDEHPTHAIEDEDLPEDLQPTDDNPLAKPLSDSPAGGAEPKSPEELDVLGGKTADETSEETPDSDD